MFYYNWSTRVDITNAKKANEMLETLYRVKPAIAAFDTETTGLHIILDKPFLYQFGFVDDATKSGYTYTVDIERHPDLSRQVILCWQRYIQENVQLYAGHNVKFDLHMMTNIGLPYTGKNVTDTMFYIRYAHDALTPKNGGPPLGLKDYCVRYIDPSAKEHESLIKRERTSIAKDLNLKLKFRLNKKYTLKQIETTFKDPIFSLEDLSAEDREAYLAWLAEDVPLQMQPYVSGIIKSDNIPYNCLNRENVTKYGHMDITLTIELLYKLAPVVKARGNEKGLDVENRLIYPLIAMERNGFKTNKEYIDSCQVKMQQYIKKRRAYFEELAETKITIGQHEKLKEVLSKVYNFNVASTSNEELQTLYNKLKRENIESKVFEFIKVLQELRTLEKWYATYIVRFQKELNFTDRLYTMINQVGTVTGRVTSDFQQFPKEAIETIDGEELFQPRKMICISGGDYDGIVYLDYSQIELRFQALYTILVGKPDLNLCRAYMPYKCVSKDGVAFDYRNPEHIKNWDKEWYFEEAPDKHWVATDVHGATTQAAFDITPDDPNFHALRYIGKRVNFAKNYGAQRGKIREMFPDKTEEEITKINDAYYKAFPGVKQYHNYCYGRAQSYSYTENLFGIKYYNVSGHNLINMLVQGSAAYYLKYKIIKLYEYMQLHNIKSKFQMQIHDELSWEKHKDEKDVFFEFKRIMESWEDGLVPLVADMEITNTTWAEKREVSTIDEI